MRLRPGVVGIVVAVPGVILLAACSQSSSKSSIAGPTTSASAGSTTATSVASTAATSAASSTTTAASTANFNSCSVVSQSEAGSAIGESVSPGVLGNATVEGGLACVFYGPSAPTPRTPNVGQPDTVRVVLVKGPDALTWYNDYKSKVNPQPITGYGDQAYFDGGASLSVLKGAAYVRIAVVPARARPSLSDEEHLATVILPKL